LHELDIEYSQHLAKSAGVEMIRRCASLNDSPIFIKAMADIVHKHLQSQRRHTNQLPLRCPGCVNASCEQMRKFFFVHHHKKINIFIVYEKILIMKRNLLLQRLGHPIQSFIETITRSGTGGLNEPLTRS